MYANAGKRCSKFNPFRRRDIREVLGRDSKNLTLLGLATAVKLEWIKQAYPEQLSYTIEHLYDRTHKRVAALKLLRFHDLVIAHEHLRDLDPQAAGRTLADAYLKEYFELPLFNHEIKQFIARVNLVNAAMPEIEIPPLDQPAIKARLSAAFSGLSLAKEAQTIHLRDAFSEHLAKEQLAWLDELTPSTILWPDGRRLKLLYQDQDTVDTGPIPPELQVKLTECFVLKEHPHICEGRVPVKLWLCKPDGKRIESTLNWLTFKSNSYPKLRSLLQKQFPGNAWP